MDYLHQLFSSNGFQPHGFCYQWNSGLLWLHVASDLLIALSYFSIPITLVYFIRKRRDLPFSWMFALFGLFIIACGTTHLMEIWNLWHAQYWLSGAIKAVTAAASVPTALLLWRIVPMALALPSNADWIRANAALQSEIRERRELEVNLRISESNSRDTAELLELTHDAVYVRSLTGEILFWNHGAELLYDWKKAEARGKLAHELLQTVFPKPLPQVQSDVFEKGCWEGELLHTCRDGHKVVVSSRWTPRLDPAGQPMAIVISNRDITQRKRYEVELEDRTREISRFNVALVDANKELESFSYSVSHDLRAPLRAIDGFSHTLLENYKEKLDDTGKDYLSRIRSATQRMGLLIDDLLNLSRVSRGPVRLQPLDLSALASSITSDLQRAQPGRHVALQIEAGLDANADPGLLRIVLENLLGNAWKFTSKLPLAHINFGKTHLNGNSAFFVRDDGAGFDPAYADRLFGAFQRLHTAAEFPGTGIGLATVQRIVRRHGGRLWAESAPNQGATFYFTLGEIPSDAAAQ
jgi:PAS domain S-box-containing protein